MSEASKTMFFKAGSSARDKAENTTVVARTINDAEVAAREAKTARLKKLRLEKEAAEREAAAASPETAAPKAKRTKRASSAGA